MRFGTWTVTHSAVLSFSQALDRTPAWRAGRLTASMGSNQGNTHPMVSSLAGGRFGQTGQGAGTGVPGRPSP